MRRKYKRFLKAAYINYDEDYCGNGSSTFIKPTVTTPIIVITGNTAIIACAVSGATIYYTLDDSTPTSSSTEYTGAITLTLSCTIKAIAVRPGMTDSEVASESYVHYLTQWKIVGNSQVHTDPFLTSWKVSGNSEVHTLPYPDGVVLPNGYKRCEYLTFDGNSYIRPNITPAYGIGVNFSFLTSTTGKSILGSRNSSYEASLLIGSISENAISMGYGKPITPVQVADLANGEKHSIILDSSQLRIDGVDYAFSGRWQFVHNIPILLGGLATGDNTFDSRCIVGNIYDTIFYDTQGELWHGIPCLDANDVPCFYDLVSQTAFYNQGSGSFTYKLYPQPTEIWSCGDLGQDGKYHVKISNGVNVFDIALTEPLRKVNDVADTIEFPTEQEGKAIVTRNLKNVDWSSVRIVKGSTPVIYFVLYDSGIKIATNNILSAVYPTYTYNISTANFGGLGLAGHGTGATIRIVNEDMNDLTTEQFKAANADVDIIYELSTPTTELVDAPQISVSPTDTYTSANEIPYSAFEHTEVREIWSCGEYNPTDGKWHILVQPLGGSIADIALTEPLRKVNDVADTIEFPSDTEGKALVTRNLACVKNLGEYNWYMGASISGVEDYICRLRTNELSIAPKIVGTGPAVALCAIYGTKAADYTVNRGEYGISLTSAYVTIRDANYAQQDSASALKQHLQGIEFIYWIEPTTELIDAPQIQEAESYSMIISQGGKAVSWSSFETE